jgi:hypothetical protein
MLRAGLRSGRHNVVITKLRKNSAAELVDEGFIETTAWAKFKLPKSLVSFRTKVAVNNYSPYERAVRAARLRQAAGVPG